MKRNSGHFLRRVMPLILAFSMVLSAPQFASAAQFSDTAGHWAGAVIEKWAGYEILSGFGDGTVHPNDPITVAQLATILNKFMKYTPAKSGYADVAKDQWYYAAMTAIKDKDILDVGESNMAYPDKYLTREEAVMMIAKAFNITTSAVSPSFKDAADIALEARMYVSAMQSYGYVVGSDGYFMPKEYFTRAHIFTLIDAIIKNYANEAKTYTGMSYGNVLVNVANAAISNSILGGDLYITPGVGTGDFTLDSVTANKRVLVQGGGKDSIYLMNKTKLNGLTIVNNLVSEVRFEADATSEVIGKMEVYSDTILDGEGLYEDVYVKNNAKLTIRSKVNKLTVEGSGATIIVEEGGEVGVIDVFASCTISGDGNVGKINVHANGVTISVPNAVIVVDAGVTGTVIDDKQVDGGATYISRGGYKSVYTTTTGGGGSYWGSPGSAGSTYISVTAVSLNNYGPVMLDIGGEYQLLHTVSPSNATNKNVVWKSSNSAVAEVKNGLVTAKGEGEALITVTTSQGGKTASCLVIVEGSGVDPGPVTPPPITYFVVEYKDASDDTDIIPSEVYAAGQWLNKPVVPGRDGAYLSDWYSDKECTQLFTFPQRVMSDIVIYAKWIPVVPPKKPLPEGILDVEVVSSMLIPGGWSYYVTLDKSMISNIDYVYMALSNGENDTRSPKTALFGDNMLQFEFDNNLEFEIEIVWLYDGYEDLVYNDGAAEVFGGAISVNANVVDLSIVKSITATLYPADAVSSSIEMQYTSDGYYTASFYSVGASFDTGVSYTAVITLTTTFGKELIGPQIVVKRFN